MTAPRLDCGDPAPLFLTRLGPLTIGRLLGYDRVCSVCHSLAGRLEPARGGWPWGPQAKWKACRNCGGSGYVKDAAEGGAD